MTAPIAFGVVVKDHEVVAEELRGLGPRVSDQRLRLRQLQLETIAQETADLGLDLLGLPPWAGQPEQPVIGLCRVPDYAERGDEGAGQRVGWRRRSA
ncbi:MAG: hypothetical protein ACRDZ4_15410 [Egibacteraceae bacterium]